MPLPVQLSLTQSSVEPMQVDAPPDENEAPEEEAYIVDNPTLDLESYANSYTGLAKLYRLLYIADHCSSLRVEALKMALSYVQNTYNVSMYQHIHRKLVEASGASTLPDVTGINSTALPLDTQWIETKGKKAALKLEKLDTDLKNYKSNSIKESIRRGHDDLGDHYLDCGDLSNALKCYSRARDYCTSGKHVVNMCLNVIKVCIVKLILILIIISCYISDMGSTLLSSNNVAMYGGLCALASFDRQELLKNIISSSSFKLFLELEPQLRDIIFRFYESKYASCLKLLDEIKDNLLLDMYLAPHVATLYTQIRNRALIQYFSPYLSADMNKMAAAFNTTICALEDELMQLILDGQIQARIDSHNKILYAKDIDQRSTTFERSLAMGKEYQRRTTALILRSAMLKNQIHVKVNSFLLNKNIFSFVFLFEKISINNDQ
ncbi:COP9 signalosome complex subunit 1-like [Centruroides sculpturatus]|uniref:COP9 signalosome complex subunit 1-like n=1 Tax=Centruroides sculpturatus TaxID=218467 RepID=UPI000C6E33B8|nr:COP9 signalosome complex subunit 1-like [Centruroides sculpturatus]